MFTGVDGVHCNLGTNFRHAGCVDSTIDNVTFCCDFIIFCNNKLAFCQKLISFFNCFRFYKVFAFFITGIQIRTFCIFKHNVNHNYRIHPFHNCHLSGHTAAHLACANNTGLNWFTFVFQLLKLVHHVNHFKYLFLY